MHTDGKHDEGKKHELFKEPVVHTSTPSHAGFDPDHPGYEVSDVNVRGILVFLGGLAGSLLVFFVLCFVLGRLINDLWVKQDGPPNAWHELNTPKGNRRDLTSNTALQQEQLQQMTTQFPQPRLEDDDGEQQVSDLHAREDVLLEHYSRVDGQPDTIRIPIERAMQLIAQRGLPVENQGQTTPDNVAYSQTPQVHAPLTTGFARTAYELTQIESRAQKMEFENAQEAVHGETNPHK